MSLLFACPACGFSLSAPADCAGRSSKCRKCGQSLVVPQPAREKAKKAPPTVPPSEALPASGAVTPHQKTRWHGRIALLIAGSLLVVGAMFLFGGAIFIAIRLAPQQKNPAPPDLGGPQAADLPELNGRCPECRSSFHVEGWEKMSYAQKSAITRPCPVCGHRASVLELEHWAGFSQRGQALDGVERPTDLILNPDKPGPAIDLPQGAPKTDLARILKTLAERMDDLAKAEGNGLILQETETRHKASLESWKGKKVVLQVEVRGVGKRHLRQGGLFREEDDKFLKKGQEPPWVVAVKPAVSATQTIQGFKFEYHVRFRFLDPDEKMPVPVTFAQKYFDEVLLETEQDLAVARKLKAGTKSVVVGTVQEIRPTNWDNCDAVVFVSGAKLSAKAGE
jgi:hypothetical protein